MLKTIQKRDGRVDTFDQEKIIKAIFKCTEAVGEPNYDLAKELSVKVAEIIDQRFSGGELPKVEQIQDIVEQVLVEGGHAKTAKSYILYRQKRTEIRQQKQQVLNKEDIDEVDKRFDLNALRVLCSRYLRKDDEGNVIESPKELFERVAVHVVLPSLFFDASVDKAELAENANGGESLDFKALQGKLKIGKYILNEFHFEGLRRLHERYSKEGKIKVGFVRILKMIENGEFDKYSKEIDSYFGLMAERKFFPNTPTLANFGSYLGMGSACFAIGIEDSIESIMTGLSKAAIIFKSGGGVGYNFSKLRPSGDFIKTTGGLSSGPISFMSLFDKMSDVIKQGGIRRGASMGILNINHPDIEDFVIAKRGNQALRNFNISVLVKRDFWEYYNKKEPYPLINPKNGKIVKYVEPQNLLNLIVYQAWESAEPGVLFEDSINKHNPFLHSLGPIQCTNPCGELPLYPDESCNLGSINVWKFCKTNPTNGREKHVEFDWEALKETVILAVRFLDNVVDVNKYPLPEIEEETLKTRKIGLGIMGLGDLLFELEIPYNSKQGVDFMAKLMEFVNYYSKIASVQLSRERGKFPYYEKSFYSQGRLPMSGPLEKEKCNLDWDALIGEIKEYGLRNSQTTTNAPTGSISMIGGCSSGIEPVFSLVFEKEVAIGSFYYVDSVFEKAMEREGLFDDYLIKEVSERSGSIKGLSYVPSRLKEVFATSMDIDSKDHIIALASLQKWTDSSISKTINFPSNATVEEMKTAYLLGYEMGCKGVTVFRDKSIKGVLNTEIKKDKKPKEKEVEMISLKDDKAAGPGIYLEPGSSTMGELRMDICPKCKISLIKSEGCKKCPQCGWGVCTG